MTQAPDDDLIDSLLGHANTGADAKDLLVVLAA